MITIVSDLFRGLGLADAICITTNCVTNSRGEAVMGRGVALAAKQRWPWMPACLGQELGYKAGRVVGMFPGEYPLNIPVLSFPTKRDWRNRSDLELIRQSAESLALITNEHGWGSVWLPPPGCGNGGLKWSVVHRALAPVLDYRFIVASTNPGLYNS